ncbi:MAG: DUF177 domain-containing protein [Mariprofundaceae bacterium]|nr:DUF177 domain-containing protein [Mariprofundaceae bacterium]
MKHGSDKFTFTLQALANTGRHWDVNIPLADFADESFAELLKNGSLLGDFSWKGSLLPSAGVFELVGKWQMQVPRQCGRCNVNFPMLMQQDVQLSFAFGDPAHLEQEGEVSEVELLSPPGEMDMLDVLREQFWLAWRPMVVCSEDCKGLCQQCGVNLNDGKCDCHGKREDHPFAALQGLKFDA